MLTALPAPPNDREVMTSVRVVFAVGTPTPDSESARLVVWSTLPGSLAELNADLTNVLARNGQTADATGGEVRPSRVVLDGDLPLPTGAASGLVGEAELATIHRAVGVLMARGHDPNRVEKLFVDDALAAGVSTHEWALQILES